MCDDASGLEPASPPLLHARNKKAPHADTPAIEERARSIREAYDAAELHVQSVRRGHLVSVTTAPSPWHAAALTRRRTADRPACTRTAASRCRLRAVASVVLRTPERARPLRALLSSAPALPALRTTPVAPTTRRTPTRSLRRASLRPWADRLCILQASRRCTHRRRPSRRGRARSRTGTHARRFECVDRSVRRGGADSSVQGTGDVVVLHRQLQSGSPGVQMQRHARGADASAVRARSVSRCTDRRGPRTHPRRRAALRAMAAVW